MQTRYIFELTTDNEKGYMEVIADSEFEARQVASALKHPKAQARLKRDFRFLVFGNPIYGMYAICLYLNKSEHTVKHLIETQGLPATKMNGRWESSTVLLDDWRARQLLE